MGGQGIERREILRYIGIATVAASFPGFSKWAFACSHHTPQSPDSTVSKSSYKPLLLSSQQYHMVERLAEMIIPEDDTPGAKQAGVAEFIDFMLANRVPVGSSRDIRSTADAIEAGNDEQVRFISGLNWMNARSHSEFGHVLWIPRWSSKMECWRNWPTKTSSNPTPKVAARFFE